MSNAIALLSATVDELASSIDAVWILVGAALVFFMQASQSSRQDLRAPKTRAIS